MRYALVANAFQFLQGQTGRASTLFIVAAVLDLVGMWCCLHMRSVEREAGV
jgi:hypothetical protein